MSIFCITTKPTTPSVKIVPLASTSCTFSNNFRVEDFIQYASNVMEKSHNLLLAFGNCHHNPLLIFRSTSTKCTSCTKCHLYTDWTALAQQSGWTKNRVALSLPSTPGWVRKTFLPDTSSCFVYLPALKSALGSGHKPCLFLLVGQEHL